MKYKQWHWPMHILAFGDAIIFFHRGWWEIFAFLGFCYIFIWNVYAYPRNKSMQAFPKMAVNVTKNGDEADRHLLFTASLCLFILLNLGWIWRYFK